MNSGAATGSAAAGELVATSIDGGACRPASPVPLTDKQLAFRSAFCEEYARRAEGRGSGAAAVRAALERVDGSRKAHTRPGEVARRLLAQQPVRDRIAELRGAPVATPLRPAALATRPETQAARSAIDLPPETAARLAAVAFDPASPVAAARTSIEALRAALDARHANISRATE